MARGELRLLVQMVQQTLEATKNFIFDVRPMVLDDLGLVPTLRRAARDRGPARARPGRVRLDGHRPAVAAGRREHRVPGARRGAGRLPRAGARAGHAPPRLDARSSRRASRAERTVVLPAGHEEALPDVPTGDVPDAIKQMIPDRHDARTAAVAAAEEAAIVVLPAAARRDITGAGGVHRRDGGDPRRRRGAAARRAAAARTATPGGRGGRMSGRAGAEGGPGILETSIVLGGSILLALVIICSSAASSPRRIGVLVDAAHGGR